MTRSFIADRIVDLSSDYYSNSIKITLENPDVENIFDEEFSENGYGIMTTFLQKKEHLIEFFDGLDEEVFEDIDLKELINYLKNYKKEK